MSKLNKKILILIFSFLIIFLLTRVTSIDQLDKDISFKFYNFLNNELVTQFFSFITSYAIGITVVVMSILIYFRNRNIFQSILFIILTVLQTIVVSILQVLIQRARPFTNNEEIIYLGNTIPFSFSFPSSHTTFAFFLAYIATKIFKLKRNGKILVYLLAFLVGLSRIYLGAHYLLDVSAGIVLGTLLGVVSIEVYRRTLKIEIK